MPVHARLVVIEQVLDDPNANLLFSTESDVTMMLLLGGKERTRQGFVALFEAADLMLADTVCAPTSFSLLIARPTIPDRRTVVNK
jgi:hypothetical protein